MQFFCSVDAVLLTFIAICLALSIGASLGGKFMSSEYEKRLFLQYFPSGVLDFEKKYWIHLETLHELYAQRVVYFESAGSAVSARSDEALRYEASNVEATKIGIEAEYKRWYRAEGIALLHGFGKELEGIKKKVDREFGAKYSDSTAAR